MATVSNHDSSAQRPWYFVKASVDSPRRKAVGPKIGDQVLGFGGICAARAKDAHQLAIITTAKLRGSRRVHGKHAEQRRDPVHGARELRRT